MPALDFQPLDQLATGAPRLDLRSLPDNPGPASVALDFQPLEETGDAALPSANAPDTSFGHQAENLGNVVPAQIRKTLLETAQGALQMPSWQSQFDDPALPKEKPQWQQSAIDQLKAAAATSDKDLGVDPKLEGTATAKLGRFAGDAGVMVAESMIPGVGIPVMVMQDASRRYAQTLNETGDENKAKAAVFQSLVSNGVFLGQGAAVGAGMRAVGAPLAARIAGATAGNVVTGQGIKAAEGGNFNDLSQEDAAQAFGYGVFGGVHGGKPDLGAPNKTAEIRAYLEPQGRVVEPTSVEPAQKDFAQKRGESSLAERTTDLPGTFGEPSTPDSQIGTPTGASDAPDSRPSPTKTPEVFPGTDKLDVVRAAGKIDKSGDEAGTQSKLERVLEANEPSASEPPLIAPSRLPYRIICRPRNSDRRSANMKLR